MGALSCHLMVAMSLLVYGMILISGKQLTRASDLDVDHVIPLKWAHDHGGGAWSAAKKEIFANDAINLLVVDDGLNQKKGAKGPDEWLPPNRAFRCEYLFIWEQVLEKYSDLVFSHQGNLIFKEQFNSCSAPIEPYPGSTPR